MIAVIGWLIEILYFGVMPAVYTAMAVYVARRSGLRRWETYAALGAAALIWLLAWKDFYR